jgi:hypothetical protein
LKCGAGGEKSEKVTKEQVLEHTEEKRTLLTSYVENSIGF